MSSTHSTEIKFYNPAANKKQLVEKIPMWRGDHSRCGGHRTGECIAAMAWTMVDGTWKLRPDIAGVSVEPTMLGTVKEEGKKGAYEIPVWQAKGWVRPEEAEGVVPSDAVKAYHVEQLVKDRRVNMKYAKYEPEKIDKECAILRAAAEKANGLAVEAKK